MTATAVTRIVESRSLPLVVYLSLFVYRPLAWRAEHTRVLLADTCSSRPVPVLPVLAGGPCLLHNQHVRRRHVRKGEMRARARGLLRVSAPQEGGKRR
jgi:hypothetical protein